MAQVRGLDTTLAPPLGLPLRYFFTAILFLVIAAVALLLSAGDFTGLYFRRPAPLFITHLLALGWVTMTIMGAMYQILPVALQVPVWSVALGKVQHLLFTVGVAGLAWGMGYVRPDVAFYFALLLLVGSYTFLFNMAASLKFTSLTSITGAHVAAALFYFFVTVTWGTLLALNFYWGFLGPSTIGALKGHAHLAVLGWVTLTIVGVLYQLLSMFYLTDPPRAPVAWASFILINVGIIGLFLAPALGADGGIIPFGSVAALGCLTFIYEVLRMMVKRARPGADLTLKFTVAALAYLVVAIGLGIGLSFGVGGSLPGLYYSYALIAIGGWTTMMIVGHLYKILPFLMWYHRYRDKVGKEPVPMLKDMVHQGLGDASFYLLNIGTVGAALSLSFENVPWTAGFAALLLVGVLSLVAGMIIIATR